MTRKRIRGPNVVVVLVAVIAAILIWAFYQYYTVEPEPDRVPEGSSARP